MPYRRAGARVRVHGPTGGRDSSAIIEMIRWELGLNKGRTLLSQAEAQPQQSNKKKPAVRDSPYALAKFAAMTAITYNKDSNLWAALECGASRALKCKDICDAAARMGRLAMLKDVRASDPPCDWDSGTVNAAIIAGRLSMVKYLVEEGCPVTAASLAIAARNGDEACLSWLLERGCPRDKSVCRAAAGAGFRGCLMIARKAGCPWDVYTVVEAAGAGHDCALVWALNHGCDRDERACVEAAKKGQLVSLRVLRLKKCPWTSQAVLAAARCGHASCVEYLLQKGCPVDALACSAAANGGHLECLRLLGEAGAPCDDSALKAAIHGGNMGCLEYPTQKHDWPLGHDELMDAVVSGNLAMVRFMHPTVNRLWEVVRTELAQKMGRRVWHLRWYADEHRIVLVLPEKTALMERHCAVLRFGALNGAPLTPAAEDMIRAVS